MKKIRTMIKKCNRKRVVLFLSMVMMSLFFNLQVALATTPTPLPTDSATNIYNTRAVTGTKNLITDATLALCAISAVVTIIMVIFELVKIQVADDDGDAKVCKKKIKKICICGISVFLVSGLFTVILKYYTAPLS